MERDVRSDDAVERMLRDVREMLERLLELEVEGIATAECPGGQCMSEVTAEGSRAACPPAY